MCQPLQGDDVGIISVMFFEWTREDYDGRPSYGHQKAKENKEDQKKPYVEQSMTSAFCAVFGPRGTN